MMEPEQSNLAADIRAQLKRRYQYYLDKTVIFPLYRWLGLALLALLYCWRAWNLKGWYIVNYGLGIFVLNLFIGFLSPQFDPDGDGPGLPTSNSEEFRPFSRKLPEFAFWYSSVRAFLIAWVMTCIPLFNIPVFWPVLVLYFIALVGLTLKDRIAHMIKHRYIPCSWGKRKYKGGKDGKKAPASSGAAEPLFKGSSTAMAPGPRRD